MAANAVHSILLRYGWKRIGIIYQQHADIIWMLTKNGLIKIAAANDIVVSKVAVLGQDPSVTTRDVLKSVAAVSRSKSCYHIIFVSYMTY